MTPLFLAIVLEEDGKEGVRKALVVERRLKLAKDKNFIVILYFLNFSVAVKDPKIEISLLAIVSCRTGQENEGI